MWFPDHTWKAVTLLGRRLLPGLLQVDCMLLIWKFAILHKIMLFSSVYFDFISPVSTNMCVCSKRKNNIYTGVKRLPRTAWGTTPVHVGILTYGFVRGILPRCCDYCDTEYIQAVLRSGVEIHEVLVFKLESNGQNHCAVSVRESTGNGWKLYGDRWAHGRLVPR